MNAYDIEIQVDNELVYQNVILSKNKLRAVNQAMTDCQNNVIDLENYEFTIKVKWIPKRLL